MYFCRFCDQEVNPLSPDSYYEAPIWRPVGSKAGGITIDKPRPSSWAHGTCIRAVVSGKKDEPTLFE